MAVMAFAAAIAVYVALWYDPMFGKMLAAASGAGVVFDPEVPWQIVSFSVRYAVRQHVDPKDKTPSVIVWSVRERFQKGRARVQWRPFGKPPTIYPKAVGPAGCLSDSLFIVSGLGLFFTIGHGDVLVFDSAGLYHGTSPIVGESKAEKEELLKRPTPYGNALFIKAPDVEYEHAVRRGIQDIIMQGGSVKNAKGGVVTKKQLYVNGLKHALTLTRTSQQEVKKARR